MKRPNILLIMTDQQRADSLGYARTRASGTGSDTPFLDGLAQRGVIFDAAYSAAPVCVPARSSLMTGAFDVRLPRGPDGLALPEGSWTIAHGVAAVGYETALIGKMHFSPIRARHGFQVVRSCEHLTLSAGYAPDDTDDYRAGLTALGLADPRGDREARSFPYAEALHPTSWITREAIEFLSRRRDDRPYFAVVSYTSPHTPHDPPERYAAMYDPELEIIPEDRFDANLTLPPTFADSFQHKAGDLFSPVRASSLKPEKVRKSLASIRALIRHIDDSVAELMRHVSLDDTVVFFTSDHGDYGGHRGLMGKVPWIPFEDLARVAFFCVGAGVQGGRRVAAPVQSADFVATTLDLTEAGPPEFFSDMESLVPLLSGGPENANRAAFCALGLGWPMIRSGKYKYIWHSSGDRVLFDLEDDPLETKNVLERRVGVADELSLHLHLQLVRPKFSARAPGP